MNPNCIKTLEISRALYPESFDCKTFHISCLFERTKILSIGRNTAKTHPINIRNNVDKFDIGIKNCCSELNCVLKAKKKYSNLNFSRLTLVNVRINKNGQITMARPCGSCESLIAFLGLKKVFFTNSYGQFEIFTQSRWHPIKKP